MLIDVLSHIGTALILELGYSKVVGVWDQVEAPFVWIRVSVGKDIDSVGISKELLLNINTLFIVEWSSTIRIITSSY
jgi:hypothetical protein